MTRFSQNALVLGCLLLAHVSATAQQPDRRVAEILDSWKRREESTHSARYRVTGTRIWPKGGSTLPFVKGEIPREELRGPIDRLYIIDFDSGRFRLEIKDQHLDSADNRIVPYGYIKVSDGVGVTTQCLNDDRAGGMLLPNITTNTGETLQASITQELWPPFEANGVIRCTKEALTAGDLHSRYRRDQFYFHENATLDGLPCVALRTFPDSAFGDFDEFLVDPARENVILRRFHILRNGKHFTEAEFKYKTTESKVVLDSWNWRFHNGPNNSTFYEDRCVVESSIVNQPLAPSEFQLDPKPGAVVLKVHTPTPGDVAPKQSKYFRVDDSGNLSPIRVVNKREVFSVGRWGWYAFIGAMACAFGLLASAVRRRFVHRSDSSSNQN